MPLHIAGIPHMSICFGLVFMCIYMPLTYPLAVKFFKDRDLLSLLWTLLNAWHTLILINQSRADLGIGPPVSIWGITVNSAEWILRWQGKVSIFILNSDKRTWQPKWRTTGLSIFKWLSFPLSQNRHEKL